MGGVGKSETQAECFLKMARLVDKRDEEIKELKQAVRDLVKLCQYAVNSLGGGKVSENEVSKAMNNPTIKRVMQEG